MLTLNYEIVFCLVQQLFHFLSSTPLETSSNKPTYEDVLIFMCTDFALVSWS